MKINASSIIEDHLETLRSSGSNKTAWPDITIFYLLPIAVAIGSYFASFKIRADAYGISVTFFGIFIALLLNIQVAMFSIFQRKWTLSDDARVAEIQSDTIADRKKLLTQINANISYLILVSCAALVIVLAAYVEKWELGIAPAVVLMIYSHFLLTLLMIVKRSHALFHKEYRDSPD